MTRETLEKWLAEVTEMDILEVEQKYGEEFIKSYYLQQEYAKEKCAGGRKGFYNL